MSVVMMLMTEHQSWIIQLQFTCIIVECAGIMHCTTHDSCNTHAFESEFLCLLVIFMLPYEIERLQE